MDVARMNEPSGAASCGIAVMAKASLPGKTKTRLVPPLSFDEAAAFNTAFLQDVAANIAAAGREAPIACYMAYGPPGANAFFQSHFASAVGLIESWYPNFGDCLFVAIESVRTLAGGNHPETSWVGIGLAAFTAVTMPLFARAKRQVGHQLGSAATVKEASQTTLCAYLSVALLVGLLLNAAGGLWWADPAAALVISFTH